MCLFEKLQNKYFVVFDFILILVIGFTHLIFFIIIEEIELENLMDIYESSPLFNFHIDKNCEMDNHIIFHILNDLKGEVLWGNNDNSGSTFKTKDKIEFDKISGYYFCYKHISYKDLLYNGQIIKKEQECQGDYPKDCGTIDTLNQHLCIKNNEKCPLYDIRIGETTNKKDYIPLIPNINIYYNNDNYNEPNKKIIGKLILSDGQPCYRIIEKLWKQFTYDEGSKNHFECELEIFGKKTDNRYSNQGSISYKDLYNILQKYIWKEINLEETIKDEFVSLYKREFFGIDRTCDEKSGITNDDYKTLRNIQNMEKICLILEFIIIQLLLFFCFVFLMVACCISKKEKCMYDALFVFLIICLVFNLTCAISQCIFLGRMIKFDLSYKCSDEITNEVIRKENINTKKSIIYTAVNLGLDYFYILFNIFSMIITFKKKEDTDINEKDKIPKISEKSESKDVNILNPKVNRNPFDGNIHNTIPTT